MDIHLPAHFKLRTYQGPLHDHMVAPTDLTKELKDRRAGKRACIVWHRRTGKDKTCFAQEIVPAMFERVGVYHYYFPTAADGRKILWNGIDKDGLPFMAHCPERLIKSKDKQQMILEMVNGSIFQILGSDRTESVGTNPVGCVFSEFSKQNPRWWDLVRPILAENGGWAIFNWTPRGKNHAFRMDRMARTNPKWFFQKLTVDDTQAIKMEAIQDDRDSGMSEAMIQQEYYCSYELSVQGAYYSQVLSDMYDDGRIGKVGWDKNYPVHVILDFGYTTAMWFLQEVGCNIHAIRYYQESGRSIDGWVDLLDGYKEKHGYKYGSIVVPCDMDSNCTRIITGKSALETLGDHGYIAKPLAKETSINEGITRTIKFMGCAYIDQKECESGLVCLEQYHEKQNKAMSTDMNPVFTGSPDKDGFDHGADAWRYVSKAFTEGLIHNKRKSGLTNSQIAALSKKYKRTG